MNKNKFQKLDISMLVPGMPFDGDTVKTESLGGSESAGYYMALELARMGHNVEMFTNCKKPGMYDGVFYQDLSQWENYARFSPHDICIVQRTPEVFAQPTAARINILWNHDLALGRNAKTIKGAMWNIDKVMVVSQYMADQYKEVYGLEDDSVFVTRNGIDIVQPKNETKRNRKTLIYAARPERGLDVLLKAVFPKILKRDPEFKLQLCTYKNSSEQLEGFYQEIGHLIDSFGDRVEHLGFLTKTELHKKYREAGAYIYPTPSPIMPAFNEVSCISAMEAMGCGLPFVTFDRGALKETLGHAGIVIDGESMDEVAQDQMVDAIFRLVEDDRFFNEQSVKAVNRSLGLGWDLVAKAWHSEFMGLFEQNNDDPIRLAKHFLRRSDIFAAEALLEPIHSEASKKLKVEIEKNYSFIHEKDGFRKQYEKIGETHTDVFDQSTNEPRFRQLVDWFHSRPDIDTVLDYGCAHGSYAVNLSNITGKSFHGVDIDKNSIEWARNNTKNHAKDPSKLKFTIADYKSLNLSSEKKVDCLLAMEVLEHVTEPWAVVDSLERWVKPGGTVFLTVPYGPWEYMSYETYPHRAHIWEFDKHDIRDMFGDKLDLRVGTLPFSKCTQLDEPIGWHVIEFTVGKGKKSKPIDMERKLKIQRPRQTVSAVMIAGPNSEDQLRWGLRTIRNFADEIVIGDCGMSMAALNIAEEFGAKIIAASDPKDPRYGFETPRNQALEFATMDWIFWMDTDECLIEPQNAFKYLRQNLFNGYSIRQHHFAVDTEFSPDMPVRLFRRKPYRGKKMRWYGCVAGETLISTPSGDFPIKDLVGQTPLIYAYDTNLNELIVTRPSEIALTKHNAEVLEIVLDDGSIIKATPNHPFLMRRGYQGTGKYTEAKDLKPGDSLMPFYRQDDHGYNRIRVKEKQYDLEHRFIYEFLNGEIKEGNVVHHIDGDRRNNDPVNLIEMTSEDHSSLHNAGKVISDKTKSLIKSNHAPCDGENNSMYGRNHSEETKKKIGERSRERDAGYGGSKKGWFTSEKATQMNKSSWADPEIRARRIAGIKAAKMKKSVVADNHKVVSIRKAGREDVYNMEVPKTKNFIAGGVVVHNCIHEHPELALNHGPGPTIVLSDVNIPHTGYLVESGRRSRFERNLPLLNADIDKYPDRKLQKHFIMRDNMLLCTYELQQNGGIVTSEIRDKCNITIAIYREHFLGQGGYMTTDSLQYYSQAVSMLGEGAEVSFAITADKGQVKPGQQQTARFLTQEDFLTELNNRGKDAISPFMNEHF